MKRKTRFSSRALAFAAACMLAAVVARVSAQPRQDSGQEGGETELRHQDRVCSQLPPGGVCLRLDHGRVETLHVQGNVYMISGVGANVTVQIGTHDVMVVDTGVARMSHEVIAAIRALTDKPIFLIVATSMDEDHAGGNAIISQAGWASPNSDNIPLGHDVSDILGLKLPPGAAILAHINMLNRMSAPSGQKAPVPQEIWPTDTYSTDDWRMYNGEEVYLYHVPAAHTDGDTIVLFRRSGVVSTGDLFTPLTSYPVIDLEKGGSIDGFIAGLNQIIDLLVPEENEEGGTYVIPGHGRICDRHEVVNYRDMVTIIRGRIDAMVKEGMTLEQVKAAQPTADYDVLGHYGATKDMFIEAVYRDLSKATNRGARIATGAGER